MQPSDVVDAMKLSDAEGWNQTPTDWSLLIEGSQNICLLAEGDKKIIGTTTAINYANRIAWIGMVLVAKEHRRQGISKSLLTNILEKLVGFKSIKLDATPEGQHVYKQFDFNDEYLIARMVNASMRELPPDDDVSPEPTRLNDLEEIIALDELVFGANRTQLIESMIKKHPEKTWVLKRNNSIVGFALGRKGNKYDQLGPVVGSNNDVKVLIKKALNELTHQPVVMDVLIHKEDLMTWLNTLGFAPQRHFVRMYKTQNPFPGIIDKQYAICGPEFG
jgi:Acetyltransferase (GNAT) domain/Acetyltransferase (GNAT) family